MDTVFTIERNPQQSWGGIGRIGSLTNGEYLTKLLEKHRYEVECELHPSWSRISRPAEPVLTPLTIRLSSLECGFQISPSPSCSGQLFEKTVTSLRRSRIFLAIRATDSAPNSAPHRFCASAGCLWVM